MQRRREGAQTRKRRRMSPRRSYETLALREDVLATIDRLAARRSQSATAALDHLRRVCAEGSDASYLRQQHERRGSPEGMVDAAIERFRNESPLSDLRLPQ